MNTQTIVIVSVLSTLGAVALITSIVVAFYKLKGKVGVDEFDQRNDDIFRVINENRDLSLKEKDDLYDYINRRVDESISHTNDIDKRLDSKIDSRCDKLYNEIMDLNGSLSQLKQSFGNRVDNHIENKKQTKLIKS